MKKLLILLVLVITLVGYGVSKNEEVSAVSMNFDVQNVSPRFQYLFDDSGNLINFEFDVFELFSHPNDINNYDFYLDQVNYDGSFIKRLETFETDFYIYDSYIREGSTTFEAGMDLPEAEYLYIGDINFLYGGAEELNVLSIKVNTIPISVSDYEFSEDNNYIIIDPDVTTAGDVILVSYMYEYADDYKYTLEYDWSGLEFLFSDIAFYRLMIGNFAIFTGSVMENPKSDIYETYLGDEFGLEFGYFLVKDDGLVDFTDQTDFTTYLNEDDYIILHYRLPSTMVDAYLYKTIQIIDINSNTIEDLFTTEAFLYLQNGTSDYMIESYIIIPINGELGDGLIVNYNDAFNDVFDYVLHDYSEGSYFIAMVDQDISNTYITSISPVWNVIEDDKDPFELAVMKYEISLDDLQRVIFYKNSELISSSYTTILAKDYSLGVSYIDEINAYDNTYAISYYLEETLLEGDNVNVGWSLEPVFMPYSLTASDYAISLTGSYEVLGETDIAGHINNSLIYYALDDELGGVIFSIFVILFFNVLLIFFTKEMFIYSFVNLVVILVLSFMGLIPMWLIIGVFILGFIGLKNAMTGGRSYE